MVKIIEHYRRFELIKLLASNIFIEDLFSWIDLTKSYNIMAYSKNWTNCSAKPRFKSGELNRYL